VSISSDNDTDSAQKSDGEYDSEHDPDVDMHMEDEVDALDEVDLASDRYFEMDTDGDEEHHEA